MLFLNINKSILPFISSSPVERIRKKQNIKVVAKAAPLVPAVHFLAVHY